MNISKYLNRQLGIKSNINNKITTERILSGGLSLSSPRLKIHIKNIRSAIGKKIDNIVKIILATKFRYLGKGKKGYFGSSEHKQ